MPQVVKGRGEGRSLGTVSVKSRGCEDEGGRAGEVNVRRWSEVPWSMLLKMKERG